MPPVRDDSGARGHPPTAPVRRSSWTTVDGPPMAVGIADPDEAPIKNQVSSRSQSPRRNQVELREPNQGLLAGLHAELVVQRGELAPDGVDRDEELIGDLLG